MNNFNGEVYKATIVEVRIKCFKCLALSPHIYSRIKELLPAWLIASKTNSLELGRWQNTIWHH